MNIAFRTINLCSGAVDVDAFVRRFIERQKAGGGWRLVQHGGCCPINPDIANTDRFEDDRRQLAAAFNRDLCTINAHCRLAITRTSGVGDKPALGLGNAFRIRFAEIPGRRQRGSIQYLLQLRPFRRLIGIVNRHPGRKQHWHHQHHCCNREVAVLILPQPGQRHFEIGFLHQPNL